jgi:hypothetical protein
MNTSTESSSDLSEENHAEKAVFTAFAKWFLRERATRYILSGNMKNKKQYVRFKNQIMLEHLNNPGTWSSNTKKIKKKTQPSSQR